MEFPKNRSDPSGYANQCKLCKKETERIGYISKRRSAYLLLYGITIEQYDEMFKNQGGKCAICGRHQSEFEQRLCVDHCHRTGKVRELLCRHCNVVLGQIETFLPAFLPYLEKHAKAT